MAVPFTVLHGANVVLNGSQANAADGTGEPALVASANQAATVVFEDWVHNTGNAPDKFNISVVAGNTFPAGTSFQLFKSDGATPLLDTNGDGVIDTGDLPTGGAYKVVLKAILPAGASGNNGGAGYQVTLRATSAADSTKFNDMENRLTTIVANTVDLTNGPGLGVGPGIDDDISNKPDLAPGASHAFPLWVIGGTTADTYTFSAGGSFANAATPVNSNFTVTFFRDASAGTCATLGAQVSDTGNVAPGSTSYFCGVVTSSASTPANTTAQVYFRIRSNTSGTSDIKRDDVTVIAANAISLNPDNAQQAFPGGNVIYTHTLANNGNATEVITLTKADTGGLSSVIYVDDGDGIFNAADTVYTGTITLLQGQSRAIFVTVAVPSNTPVGTSSVTTITATAASGATDNATDTTNVVGGFIRLDKTGKNDVACNGTLTDAAAFVKPNECLEYTVIATNIGSFPAEQVVINDVVPAYTSYQAAPAPSCTGSAGVTCPAPGVNVSGGAVSTTPVDLQPGQSVTLKFTVRVDPLAP